MTSKPELDSGYAYYISSDYPCIAAMYSTVAGYTRHPGYVDELALCIEAVSILSEGTYITENSSSFSPR
jgi:hypothetical protein